MEPKLSTGTPSTVRVEVGTLLQVCNWNEEIRRGELLWVRVTEAHDNGSFTGTFVTPSTIREVGDIRIGDTVTFDRRHIQGRTRQPDRGYVRPPLPDFLSDDGTADEAAKIVAADRGWWPRRKKKPETKGEPI